MAILMVMVMMQTDMFCWNCSQVCSEGRCHCVDSDNDDYEDGHNDNQTNCRFGVAAQIF